MTTRHPPQFVVGETIGRLEVVEFRPKEQVKCRCLECGKFIFRSVTTLNHAKALKYESSCKDCMKVTRRKRAVIVSRSAIREGAAK
jgi:hypothetical protein